MKIVLIGPKGAGKSAVGHALADLTGLTALETDAAIEQLHAIDTQAAANHAKPLTCREIFQTMGEDHFRQLERLAVREVTEHDWHIIITGGGAFMDPENRRLLRDNAIILYLIADTETLWQRVLKNGLPPWLSGPNPQNTFDEQLTYRDEIMRPFADAILDTTTGTPEALAQQALKLVEQELAVRQRAANTFGDIIRVTTFGESHGTAIGCILEGVQPGIEIALEDIQRELDRRKPGQSKVTTQRKEPDQVEIFSGIYDGKTTGAPIAMVIYNKDQDSKKYDEIKDLFRPGHADWTFYQKYGFRDHRGGGRSSGRETATRVAAGAVALKILQQRGITIRAHAVEIAGIKAETCDYDVIEQNPVRCADPKAAKLMEEAILAARKDTDSVGGIIQLDILGAPPGLGDPVFAKLDARLTYAIMTIGAIKGVEVGDGFALTRLRGSEANDEMAPGPVSSASNAAGHDAPASHFITNHGGGITGGISTGQPIVLRVAVKPTASIAKTQHTIDKTGQAQEISTGGRHDPCIVPRAVPVIEHMAALVILDACEIQDRLRPR